MMEPDIQLQFVFDTLRDDLAKMREDINARLDAINGTVRRHDRELAIIQNIAHDPHDCPLSERVDEIDQIHTLYRRLGRIVVASVVGTVTLAGVVFQAISYLRGH